MLKSPRVLCVTAHPDDEAAAFGGALLMAHAQGVETSVLCLTDGSAGSYRAAGQSDRELARLRRAEFSEACKSLGVSHAAVLDYQDGRLAQLNFLEMASTIARHIRRLRPQVVLTFGGEGGVNLHRDHMMVSFAATAAFHWSGREKSPLEEAGLPPYAPQKLYYAGTPFLASRSQHDRSVAARVPCSITLELGDMRERKLEAFLKHASQRGILERIRAEMEPHLGCERYLLAAARNWVPGEDTALFSGVVED